MAKKKAKAVGFVLPTDGVESDTPKTMGGLPGVWTPGHVHLASEFGLTDDEMRGFIEQGYGIREVEVEAGSEEALEKTLATARVDEVGAEAVEGTPTAEKSVKPAEEGS